MTYTITNVIDDEFTMDDNIRVVVIETRGIVSQSDNDNVNVGTGLRVIVMPNVGDVVDVYDGWLYPVIDGTPDGVTTWGQRSWADNMKREIKYVMDAIRECVHVIAICPRERTHADFSKRLIVNVDHHGASLDDIVISLYNNEHVHGVYDALNNVVL